MLSEIVAIRRRRDTGPAARGRARRPTRTLREAGTGTSPVRRRCGATRLRCGRSEAGCDAPVDVPGAAKEVADWLHRARRCPYTNSPMSWYVVHRPSGIAALICLICSRLTNRLYAKPVLAHLRALAYAGGQEFPIAWSRSKASLSTIRHVTKRYVRSWRYGGRRRGSAQADRAHCIWQGSGPSTTGAPRLHRCARKGSARRPTAGSDRKRPRVGGLRGDAARRRICVLESGDYSQP
jgi:hypothetical protein